MRARAWSCAAVVLSLAALGCGGGVDEEDPRAVALALAEANYRCDATAVEQINDLTLPAKQSPIDPDGEDCDAGRLSPVNSGQLDAFDRNSDQPLDDPPPRTAAAGDEDGDFVTVLVEEDDATHASDDSEITLVRTDAGWRWDPGGEAAE